jgi:NADH-quinone oxidoreductase subunit M
MSDPVLLSLIVFVPCLGALVLAFMPKEKPDALKLLTVITTTVVLLLAIWMGLPGDTASGQGKFVLGEPGMQNVFALEWIPSFGIQYFMGLDGISYPFVVLTAFLCLISMVASWGIEKNVKAYCILYLILETGILGVFVALDFFLFFVFWEVMLLPMYFLIGVWGGPRREYAAIKFFLYTMLGGVLMLVAILMLYFASDLRELTDEQLAAARVTRDPVQWAQTGPIHTFNILALQQIGQHTDQFSHEILWGQSISWWAFLLLFIGFAIKVPAVPVHTWLPDAHVEAPTPISMLLAGILLKLGGYGIIRICYPICPEAGYDLRWFVCFIGALSMVYGAFAAMAQKDFKRLVAYSSVSHMGYVVLGMGVWSAVSDYQFNADYWKMGMNAAVFQMIAHGISSPGMFFMVGVLYDRVHHRNLDEFGGMFRRMPTYSGLAIVIFFAGLGLPGLCGFWGEAFVTLSVWNFSRMLTVIAAFVVIITAGYILWTVQRVYLGAEYRGPHEDHLHEITPREIAVAVPLVVLCIVLGVYPAAVFNYVTPSVNSMVDDLAQWSAKNIREDRAPTYEARAPQLPELTPLVSRAAHAEDPID